VSTSRVGQFGVPAAVIAIVVMMVVPLPTQLLDVLIAANITGALLILLVCMYVSRPLDFAVFPSLLLVATLFRLALNVSVTRLVLLHGYAGTMVQSFGHFVVGGSIIVGLVVFFILIVIQFIVITNGAGRVAEVGARFTLDAMPGKQMAIDADLNSGLIDQVEARRRRAEVAAEADFYGAMDGASKFVKGDAIAAIVITLVNLIGGLIVGVMQRHMTVADAASTYSLLSVGDGLVSQIPALLISVSTGLIVTRATTGGDMGSDLLGQFGRQRKAMRVGGLGVIVIALIPGLPKIPFFLVGGLLLLLSARPTEEPDVEVDEAPAAIGPAPDSTEAIAADMRVEPLQLELAVDLVDLVDANAGGDLLTRVKALRRKLALELGIVIPLVRTRDNADLPVSTYAIRLNDVEMGRGEAPPHSVLAIGDELGVLPGVPTQEPVFGLAAKWIPVAAKQQAELMGATVVDRASVITTHLAEVVRTNAGRLLGREDVKALTELVRRSHPVVIEEMTPALLSLGDIQRVLTGLLDESVPIRDLVRIFESISARARVGTDTEGLVEAARATLGPAIAAGYAAGGRLPLIALDPQLEQSLVDLVRAGDGGSFLALDFERAELISRDIARLATDAERRGDMPVLACSPQLRPALRKLVKTAAPRLPVLSYSELGGQLRLETVGVVNSGHPVAA
jgi:flagellar biosynthesis protein FlhA